MIGTILYKPIQDTFIDLEKVVTDTFTETVQVPDETSETGFRDEEVTRTEERIEYERVKNDAPNTREKYAQMAGWCNRNNARIVDKGDYYEVEAIPAPTAEEQAEIDLNEAKQVRSDAVEAITVEVDGLVFDGDETSQNRMARAVTMFNLSGFAPEYTTSWVLADGTVAQVTVAQLGQALIKAGLAQTALWTVPYES